MKGRKNEVKYDTEIQGKLINFHLTMATVTNYHRLDCLKKHKFILLQF